MKRHLALILFSALSLQAVAGEATQDTLILTDGTRLQGRVTEDADDHVTLQDQGVERKISRARVLKVTYNDAPAAQATATPAMLVPTTDPEATEYYNGVAEHYHVPATQVVYVMQQGVAMEEVPVVFELATRARVAPGVVLGLRLGGLSWREVGLHFGIGTEAFYVDAGVGALSGRYGSLYSRFWHRPRRTWAGIVLSDADIIDCVNLSFVSGHWHRPVREVITFRSSGQRYHQVWARYARPSVKAERRAEHRMEKGSPSRRPADHGGHEARRDHDRRG